MATIGGIDLSGLLSAVGQGTKDLLGAFRPETANPTMAGLGNAGQTDLWAGLSYGQNPALGGLGGASNGNAALSGLGATSGGNVALNGLGGGKGWAGMTGADLGAAIGSNPLWTGAENARNAWGQQQAQEQAAEQARRQATQPFNGGNDFSGPATSEDNRTLTGATVNAFIASKFANSPLAGQGDYILQIANQYGVSVPILLGIGWKESGMGTNTGAGNIFGITDPTRDGGLGGQRAFQSYGNVRAEIEAAARNLASDTYRGKSAADQIGIWYTGKPGDPNATDLAGNGTVGQYLQNFIAPTYAGLGIQFNPSGTGTRTATAGSNAAVATAQQYTGLAYTNEGIRVTGNPRDGFDCSSLTGYVNNLPRNLWNAQAQYDYTARVNYADMQVGDLIFFRDTVPPGSDPSAKPVTHVGIYAGNGMMTHSGDNGVQTVALNTKYWNDHYYGSGRITRQAGDNTGQR